MDAHFTLFFYLFNYRAVCHPLRKRHGPHKFILLVICVSVIMEIPRFFQFKLVDNYTDYWTTSIMENPTYIRFSSYWDELITSGIVPLLALIYYNSNIYCKVSNNTPENLYLILLIFVKGPITLTRNTVWNFVKLRKYRYYNFDFSLGQSLTKI